MGNKQSQLQRHLDTSNLTGVFQLQNAKLIEIPPEIFGIGNLRTLDLAHNRIKELSHDVVKLKNLRSLQLSDNLLEHLPESLGELPRLETLSLASNRLLRLPTSLSKLATLKTIDLSDNQLTAFPVQLTTLRHLDFIDLSRNRLTSLPAALGELNACELNLNFNQISKIDPAVARAPRLKVLRLDENCLQVLELESIISSSAVSTLSVEGNLFKAKELSESPGYDKYMERYTASKKKM